MKIILLHDIPKLGKKYDVCEVSSGYARSFLFPKNMAELATTKGEKRAGEKKKETEGKKIIEDDLLTKNLESLKGKIVVMKEKINSQGHLFAGVHKEEISKKLQEEHIDIPAQYIDLEHPIKEAGEFEITAGAKDKLVKFKLKIEEI